MPLPSGVAARAANNVAGKEGGGDIVSSKRSLALEQAIRDLRTENKRLRAGSVNPAPYPPWAEVKGGGLPIKGKGKGKVKGKRPGPSMPPTLIGKAFQTAGGEPICFQFNLQSGCSLASPGGRCPRGFHVCAEPG
eukprot:2670746-Heterocapsa_arctica.AAC.1